MKEILTTQLIIKKKYQWKGLEIKKKKTFLTDIIYISKINA